MVMVLPSHTGLESMGLPELSHFTCKLVEAQTGGTAETPPQLVGDEVGEWKGL